MIAYSSFWKRAITHGLMLPNAPPQTNIRYHDWPPAVVRTLLQTLVPGALPPSGSIHLHPLVLFAADENMLPKMFPNLVTAFSMLAELCRLADYALMKTTLLDDLIVERLKELLMEAAYYKKDREVFIVDDVKGIWRTADGNFAKTKELVTSWLARDFVIHSIWVAEWRDLFEAHSVLHFHQEELLDTHPNFRISLETSCNDMQSRPVSWTSKSGKRVTIRVAVDLVTGEEFKLPWLPQGFTRCYGSYWWMRW